MGRRRHARHASLRAFYSLDTIVDGRALITSRSLLEWRRGERSRKRPRPPAGPGGLVDACRSMWIQRSSPLPHSVFSSEAGSVPWPRPSVPCVRRSAIAWCSAARRSPHGRSGTRRWFLKNRAKDVGLLRTFVERGPWMPTENSRSIRWRFAHRTSPTNMGTLAANGATISGDPCAVSRADAKRADEQTLKRHRVTSSTGRHADLSRCRPYFVVTAQPRRPSAALRPGHRLRTRDLGAAYSRPIDTVGILVDVAERPPIRDRPDAARVE